MSYMKDKHGFDATWVPKNALLKRTALQAATNQGKIELVQILIDAGADANAPTDYNESTTLQTTMERNNIKPVQILLDAAATEQGSVELVRILLDAGADVNAPASEYYGRTALQAVMALSSPKLAQILLDAGADVNAPAPLRKRITALQFLAIWALLSGFLRMVRMSMLHQLQSMAGQLLMELQNMVDWTWLLNAGAIDTENLGNMRYANAVKLATINGHHTIAKLLRDYSN
ncbi:ankyrin repeat-containing domain protein [Trichophaea hybrida]|nr:ankyrin repeat-containing domain protein [Trichophaea hybrida]